MLVSACAGGGVAGPSGVPTTSTLVLAPWMTTALPVATTTTAAPPPSPTTVPAPVVEPVAFDATEIGTSVAGRPLEVVTTGAGERRLYVVGGIHGDERAAVANSERLADIVASLLPDDVTMRWLLDANPDGTAVDTRYNSRGVDLNRNWPTDHRPSLRHGIRPLSEPESAALAADLGRFVPHVIVVLHADRGGPLANYDGEGRHLAAAFAEGAGLDRRWRVEADVGVPTPGSLGTHYGKALGIPTISVVLDPRDDPEAVFGELVLGFEALLGALVGDS